jgi:hypothetical protein
MGELLKQALAALDRAGASLHAVQHGSCLRRHVWIFKETSVKLRGMNSPNEEAELYFALVPAPDDEALTSPTYQKELQEFYRALQSKGIDVSARYYVMDSGRDVLSFMTGGMAGEFSAIADALSSPETLVALLGVLGVYLKARLGRKVRLRVGLDGRVEAEAGTVEEVKELVKMVPSIVEQQKRPARVERGAKRKR